MIIHEIHIFNDSAYFSYLGMERYGSDHYHGLFFPWIILWIILYQGYSLPWIHCGMDQKNILILDGNKTEFPSTTLRTVPVIW